MSLEAIKAEIIDRWDNQPAAQLCVLILDFIHNLPPGQREMLTYNTFAKASGRESVDRDLLTAISILSSSRLSLLDARALFVSEDEEEYEIDQNEFKHALAGGPLAHPETGELVADWKRHIVPFFIPSSNFLAAEE